VLLGDEPVLGVEFSYYQRLLARDEDEATDLVEEHLQHKPVEDVYDDLLLPGLMLAKRDKERGELPADDEAFVYQVTGRIVSQVVGQHQHVKRIANGQVAINGDGEALKTSTQRVLVFGCPARDEADELALRMFAQALDCADCRIE